MTWGSKAALLSIKRDLKTGGETADFIFHDKQNNNNSVYKCLNVPPVTIITKNILYYLGLNCIGFDGKKSMLNCATKPNSTVSI